jgi:hypothetical protein
MNFRSLTQIFSRTRSVPLNYEERPNIGKKKILIVDDNPDIRKLFALVLKNSNYKGWHLSKERQSFAAGGYLGGPDGAGHRE